MRPVPNASSSTSHGEPTGGEDETLLGVAVEATGFAVLAAALALALAAAAWLRPQWRWALALAFVVMLGFAAVDGREVVHQLDEDDGGLAFLAASWPHCTLPPPAWRCGSGNAPAPPGRGAAA